MAPLLRCGFLAAGFARFRCGACHTERPVALLCTRSWLVSELWRRRMAERAAHVVDHVLAPSDAYRWRMAST
jgi:hypothetical protein